MSVIQSQDKSEYFPAGDCCLADPARTEISLGGKVDLQRERREVRGDYLEKNSKRHFAFIN